MRPVMNEDVSVALQSTTNLIEQDKAQRLLALDPRKSFIVQAPAGSGKTELLIQRFLTLLNQVKTPEEILAITFTKKAANEMRARVIKALKQAQNETEPESEHAKQTWSLARQVLARDQKMNWNLLDNPNQLRIQTIDSLCSYLTKQLPLLSHFGSQPDIADKPESLYREAVQEVLMHVEQNYEWSSAVSTLLLHLDNDLNKLHDLLITLLAKRDQWLSYIRLSANTAEIKTQLENHLALVITDSLTNVYALFPRDLLSALLPIMRYAADNLAITKPDTSLIICRDLTRHPGTHADDKKYWLAIATFLLTDKKEWRKSFDVRNGIPAAKSFKHPAEVAMATMYKEQINEIIAQLHGHDDLLQALADIHYLPDATYQDNQWEVLQALLQVLKVCAAQLRVTFQQYGKIDFIENTQAALTALGHTEQPTDLALALDYQIRHILIDEFQDTAITQYQLLEKLTAGWETNDGRTLFVVGDPMQSIYRFREAEVGLFIRMRSHGIGHIKLIPLTLTVNFRSTTNIVDWNNTNFQHIFPHYNDIATGAVTYSPSVTSKDALHDDSLIQIHGFADDDKQIQAHAIVTLIEQTKAAYPTESIAILVRSRPHLQDIIPALKKARIPYRAVEIDPLGSRQIIQDLLALTRAFLHPADRISWLAILRAPWCGLTLSDLLIVANDNPHAAILEQLDRADIINKLSAEGQTRIQRILPIVKSNIAERERHSLRYWIESTWLSLGGPACLPDLHDMDDVNAYFKLLEEFGEQGHHINIDNLQTRIEALYAAALHDESSVQIMTIHSAKGLEFDTVILPRLENKPAHDSHSLLLWMERPLMNDQIALLLAPIHATGDQRDGIYEYVHRQQNIKTDFEINRLFYVATTRAKKRLHLYFNVTPSENGEFKIESGSFLKKIWPLIEAKQHTIIQEQAEQPFANTNPSHNRPIMRLTSTWRNAISPAEIKHFTPHLTKSGFTLTDPSPQIIGTVTHRILQELALQGVDWWTSKNTEQQSAYVKHQLIQNRILPQHIERTLAQTLRIVTNTLKDERGLWILKNHQSAQSEFAVTAQIEGEWHNLVIDRTFIDTDGTRWIIDYKTTLFTQADLHDFLEREKNKYQAKMDLYREAMSFEDHRDIRLGLYFPAIPAWKEL